MNHRPGLTTNEANIARLMAKLIHEAAELLGRDLTVEAREALVKRFLEVYDPQNDTMNYFDLFESFSVALEEKR